ncbi:DUF6233 domain-containing protein [Streptomyces sp. NPDC087440]|uniref:DUF6233 domain-containing protein n=1 Tax=Streptomyces sp. NPDC087440 TaxID=3365790 RepID=UPI00382F47CA
MIADQRAAVRSVAAQPQPGPPVRVLFPDGPVVGRLVRRRQTAAGSWIYDVAIRAWAARAASTGRDLIEEWLELPVPATHVRPVPGASYESVDTLRIVRPAAEPAAEDLPKPDGQPVGWLAEHVQPRHRPSRVPGVRLHEPDCWAINGKTGGTLGTEEALKWLKLSAGQTDAPELCDVCRARTTLGAPAGE